MEFYDKKEIEILADSLASYWFSLNELRKKIESKRVETNLKDLQENLRQVFEINREMDCVDNLHSNVVYHLKHEDFDEKEDSRHLSRECEVK